MNKVYIEKNAFLKELNERIFSHCGNSNVHGLREARDMLEVFIPANVKPVVRGEWKCESRVYPNYGPWNKWYCSCCGYMRTAGWEHTSEGKRPNACFCENCGADMRGENK